jgi:hypothetical protein
MTASPQSEKIEYPVLDGFLYNTNLRCNLRFASLAIGEYDALRRSGAFRPKDWCIPEDSELVSVPAYDSYEYQVSCAPGAAVWGYTFTKGGSENDYSIQVTDACTDVPLFSEPLLMNQGTHDPDHQQYLARLLVVPSGLLNVIICNLGGSADSGIQLILHGGEPACL